MLRSYPYLLPKNVSNNSVTLTYGPSPLVDCVPCLSKEKLHHRCLAGF